MNYEIKSTFEVEITKDNGSTVFRCPRNSEGTIHFLLNANASFKLYLLENSHWTINGEYLNGDIIENNYIEIN